MSFRLKINKIMCLLFGKEFLILASLEMQDEVVLSNHQALGYCQKVSFPEGIFLLEELFVLVDNIEVEV